MMAAATYGWRKTVIFRNNHKTTKEDVTTHALFLKTQSAIHAE